MVSLKYIKAYTQVECYKKNHFLHRTACANTVKLMTLEGARPLLSKPERGYIFILIIEKGEVLTDHFIFQRKFLGNCSYKGNNASASKPGNIILFR